ncbi:MAG TPA: GNAT family N-acetyltransferase [Candidatus Limnocylindria bacterium]|nr:GNAT family N-acetyltransferase [Candidatus Limnocylindria bacterium]
MPLPSDLRMRDGTREDVPAIVALRDAVGWRGHEWALRAVVDAPAARLVVVVGTDDAIAGVGSGIAYGALGVVGNMIVTEPHRRRGVGSAILETVLDYLRDERGCRRLELFATSDGRPLYARHGFEPIEPGARAYLPRVEASLDGATVGEVAAADVGAIAAYDAPRFGGDRSSLLSMMAADAGRPLLVARRDGDVAGYAWLRPEEGRMGPFLADDPDAAAELVAAAWDHAAGEPLSVNVPTSNRTATAWLESIGVELDPWDGRMARGPQVPRRESTIYGSVVGALG